MTKPTKNAWRSFGLAVLAAAVAVAGVQAQESVSKISAGINKKMVKLFGAGGFKGLPSYGTGIVVSPQGHILTVNNHILASTDVRCHLYDGRLYHCKVLYKEPELDLALVRINEEDKVDNLDYFDIVEAAKKPKAGAGDWVFGFSNCFKIATGDEPMSVQRGTVQALTELRGRKGVFDAPYQGEAYFVDGIICNPGSAGGVLTNLKGELIGIIGRELKNTLSDTWINYAVPITATANILRGEKTVKVDVAAFVNLGIAGKYVPGDRPLRDKGTAGGFHGIILVHNAVPVTPPYVEEVVPDSPAAKAGLRPDDLIVYVDGELVSSIRNFHEVMRHVGVDDVVTLDVQRGNKIKSVKLKLAKQPKTK